MAARIVAKGKVIIGTSLGINTGGGNFIVGLDATTGKEAWRFSTIARPGEPGGDSWNGAPFEQRFGAGVWTSGSYDPARNLVYFGTGNTYDVGTLMLPQARAGESKDALYTDSTLALDPGTGKLVWHSQHMKRDVWDLDWVFEQSLLTLPVNGKPTELVVTGGKTAIFDAMDRATGKYVFSRDLGLQNIVTAIDPVTGEETTNPALEPEPGKTKLLCPNSNGARNWPTTAFDPASLYPLRAAGRDLRRLQLDAAQRGGDRGGRQRYSFCHAAAPGQRRQIRPPRGDQSGHRPRVMDSPPARAPGQFIAGDSGRACLRRGRRTASSALMTRRPASSFGRLSSMRPQIRRL